MTHVGAAARGASQTLLAQATRFLMQIIGLVVLARLLDPADFGVVGTVAVVAGVAAVLGDLGMSMATIQRETSRQQQSNLFWINVACGVAVAVSLIALALPLAGFFNEPAVTAVCQWLALITVIQALSAQFRAQATRNLKFKQLALLDVIVPGIALFGAISSALAGAGFIALLIQQLLVAVGFLIGLLLVSRWWPQLPRRGANTRELVKFGRDTALIQLLAYSSSNVDIMLVGRLSGLDAAGEYERANQIFKLPFTQVASPLTRVAFPLLARNFSEPDVFARHSRFSYTIVAYTLGAISSIFVIIGDRMVIVLLGPQWETAAAILWILAVGGVFQALTYPYYWFFLASGRVRRQLKYSLISRPAMIAVVAFGAFFGPQGAAAGFAVGNCINFIVMTFAIWRESHFDGRPIVSVSIRVLITLAVSTATSVGAISLVDGSSLPSAIALMGASWTIVTLSLAILCKSIRADLLVVWRFVQKRFR